MEKMYPCKISSCRKHFKNAEEYISHIHSSKHPQKSVIEDTLGAIACHYCDQYLANNAEFDSHHLTDDHYAKLTQLSDKVTQKCEPRNYKCKSCHTWFGLYDAYVYHMENETHKHGCPYCGLQFALPSSRRTHIQSHHVEKHDVCEICSMKQGL